MTNLLTASIISITSLCLWSGFSVRICVEWPNYGIRRSNYCYVDIKKNYYSQMLLFDDAVTFCRDNGGFVNNSALSSSDFAVLKMAEVNSSGVRLIHQIHKHRLRTLDQNCSKSFTTRPGCQVVCAFKSCPLGTFGFPKCQSVCRCEDADHCDIATGLCVDTNCTRGFFRPPVCRKCNCNMDTLCNKQTGECPLGCKKGWRGQSCQLRGCHGGKCPRYSSIENGNCTSGENCTKLTCPQGFYGPPDCNMTCYCLYPEFCDEIDGDCGGTPCVGRRTGRKCLDLECPLMYFGVPGCSSFCFCKDNQPCDTRKGKCPIDCKTGWSGETCNQRLCPVDRYGYPACNLECSCKNKNVCNSLSGVCEVLGCADGRVHGTNCTKTTSENPPEGVVSSAYSKFSAFAVVFGTMVVVAAVCVQSMTHTKEPQASRRSTMVTSGAPSTDSWSSLQTQRKSRMSYIQMDNVHLSITPREPIYPGNTNQAPVGHLEHTTAAIYPSSCVDNMPTARA